MYHYDISLQAGYEPQRLIPIGSKAHIRVGALSLMRTNRPGEVTAHVTIVCHFSLFINQGIQVQVRDGEQAMLAGESTDCS